MRLSLQISLLALLLATTFPAFSQTKRLPLFSLEPADTLHPKRFWGSVGLGAGIYSATMYNLYNSWYRDYPQSNFHTFNDLKEWQQMDKMGHWLMSYNNARWVGMAANWTGMHPTNAAWAGFAGGELVMCSFEIFDGFSKEWGWSWGDVGFNTLGSGLYLAQQLAWHEQRIFMKMSAWPVNYSTEPLYAVNPGFENSYTTLKDRATDLYGTAPLEIFLKNYNALNVWVSVNPRSFMPKNAETWLPRWLNVAVGMGADNLFSGFDNEWDEVKGCANCAHYRVDPLKYPRTRQFFLSLDVDTSRIHVKNRFLRTLLQMATIFKFPAPTLEWRDHGGFVFHAIYL